MRALTNGGKFFFLVTTKLCAKKEFFKTVIVTFETQVSEEQKNSEKLNFEVSIWVGT